MNKEQIVEYLEKEIALLERPELTLTPHGSSKLSMCKELLNKIKEIDSQSPEEKPKQELSGMTLKFEIIGGEITAVIK